jgi:hypothetical protein
MNVRCGLLPLVILLSVLRPPPTQAADQIYIEPTSAQSAGLVTEALQRLERFKSSHSLADLKAAVSTMGAAYGGSTFTPRNVIVQRRAIVSGWAPILKAIEESYGPTFDPHDPRNLPESCLLLVDYGGPDSPTCNPDPLTVRDPDVRAKYVAALRQNEVKLKRTNYWHELSIIDEEAMARLEVTFKFLRQLYPQRVFGDSAILDAILRSVDLSNARRKTLDAYFESPAVESRGGARCCS